MSVHASWYTDDQTIIHIQFMGKWQWADFHTAFNQSRSLVSQVDHPVDILMDFTQSEHIPNGAIGEVRRAAHDVHPNRRFVMVVGVSKMLDMLFRIVKQIYPSATQKMNTADSIELALDKLEELRSTV